MQEAPTLGGHAGLSVLPLCQFETDGGEKLLVSVSPDRFFFFFFCLLSAAELRSLPLLVLLPCLTQLLSVLSGQGGCFCQTPSQALQGPAEGHAELLEGSRALPLPPPPTLLSENLALTERCPLPKQGGFKPLL